MKKLIWWKIYYSGGKSFSCEEGNWLSAPTEKVQVVAELYSDGTSRLFHGADYYISELGKTWKTDTPNAIGGAVKVGAWASVEDYTACIKKAREDVRHRWEQEPKRS